MRRLFVSCGLLGALFLWAGCGGKEPAPAAGTGSSGTGNSAAAGSTDVELGAASTAPPAAGEAPSIPDAPAASTPPATAQTPSTPDAGPAGFDGLDLNRITADDAVAMVIRPAQAFKNPIVQQVLAEIEQSNPEFNVKRGLDEMRERHGVDASEVESVLVVVSRDQLALLPMMLPMMMMGGPPPGFHEDELAPPVQATPDAGKNCDEASSCDDPLGLPPQPRPPLVFVKFSHPVDPKKLVGGGASNEEQVAGKTIYLQDVGSAAFTLLGDGSLAAFGDAAKVREVIEGKPTQAGPLAETLKPMLGREFAVAVDVRPLHDFLSQMFQQNPNPMAAMAGGLVKQVNTLTLTADLTGPTLLQLDLHSINDNSAQGLQGMLGGLLDAGKQQYAQVTAMKADQLKESEKAIKPLVDAVVNGSKVTAAGSVCSFTVSRPEGVEKLPELLKPLLADMKVQAENARQMSSIRELGIAFHNYADTYRKFPTHDGPGDDGRPGKGLSWRVHLLPYLEQNPLYHQFHLDEPWDSEHNKSLIAQMPAIFGSDPDGKTSIHVFTGEGTPLGGEAGLWFADITDGTSNTILLVEAGPDTADVWTKPGGVPFDAEDPIQALGNIGDTFIVVLMDGSSRRVSKTIDAAVLKNLIQYNDGNVIGNF